jgi:hypothetical protein
VEASAQTSFRRIKGCPALFRGDKRRVHFLHSSRGLADAAEPSRPTSPTGFASGLCVGEAEGHFFNAFRKRERPLVSIARIDCHDGAAASDHAFSAAFSLAVIV